MLQPQLGDLRQFFRECLYVELSDRLELLVGCSRGADEVGFVGVRQAVGVRSRGRDDGVLLQAQGRSIASASGFVPRTAVTCDGSTVNHLSVQLIADNLPLRRGDAVVGVSAEIGPGEGGNFGASGPTPVKLR